MADLNHPHARPFSLGQGGRGVLLFHGFTGSPAHVRWLGEGLHAAGYTVRAPLLPGHGTRLEDMERVRWYDWLAVCRDEYARLRETCDFVCVSGLSMGGILAILLAAEYPVDALVAMCAPVMVRQVFSPLAPLIAPIVRRTTWRERQYPAGYDELRAYDLGYGGAPMASVGDLNRLIGMAKRQFFAVVAPTLIAQSERDHTVIPRSALRIHAGVSSEKKRLLWLPNSDHLCTIGPDRQLLLDEFTAFLRSL